MQDEASSVIRSGTIIACYLDKYHEEEPQLGQVTQDTEANSDIEVEWMVGGIFRIMEDMETKRRGNLDEESAVSLSTVSSGT